MRLVFGDTAYWVALIDRKDQWHAAARAVSPALATSRIVTTDEVLIEVFTFFSPVEPELRAAAVRFARRAVQIVDRTAPIAPVVISGRAAQ